MKFSLFNILFFTLFCFCSHSQAVKTTSVPLRVVIYDESVNPPLSLKETQLLKEVYGTHLFKEILDRPNRLLFMKELLRNRIQVMKIENTKDQKNSKLLSEFPLFNAFVPELERDLVFDPQNFNPLKYNLPFYCIGLGTALCRIDGTDYFIFIKSQHYKR